LSGHYGLTPKLVLAVKPPLASTHPRQNRPQPTGARSRHPLLGAFPLLVMSLAAVLVLFTLAMAQLNAGSDQDLGHSPSSSLLAKTPAPTP
jgi:hypothetical protein